jgi:hypothetical protein
MKQFQKYGVAAAVASVAVGAVAQVSKNETGDLAIIPYYTVLDGKNTGMHIINTTGNTQTVKVRLRRGADSADALDFNLVMSPYDEWTANIGPNPDGDGVIVSTNDTTCTVPAFPEGGAVMPSTFAEGAEEGYVEIIGMGAASTSSTMDIAAIHDDGVPLSCAVVRNNFFRVADAKVGDSTVKGTHLGFLTSSGVCSTAAAATGGACDIKALREAIAGSAGPDAYNTAVNQAMVDYLNLSFHDETPAGALKVSWMITDSDGGLEIGDNAVMVEDFGTLPMMTNQQLLDFGNNGKLVFDPLNFELPNLAYGAWALGRSSGLDAIDGEMFNRLRASLNTDSIINDWAAFSTDTGTVATDWVVTLPGQYVMNNPICKAYDAYAEAATACAVTTAAAASGLTSAGVTDDDELPLIVSSASVNALQLYDREELDLTPETPTGSDDLGFSPGGSAGEAPDTYVLNREVNVISFNEGDVLGTAADQDEDLGLGFTVTVADADRGWGEMDIISSNASPSRWSAGLPTSAGVIDPNDNSDGQKDGWGSFTPVAVAGDTMVVGFAAWERSFADQAGNYGRAIEHSSTGVRS